jgi:hypothetical protein
MTEWSIIPFVSVGPIAFGMPRVEVRRQVGGDYRSFKKTPRSTNDTDDFFLLRVHIYYDDSDRVKLIEGFSAAPTRMEFRQLSFVSESVDRASVGLSELGYSVVRELDGCYFPEIGISCYAPDLRIISAVGAFNREEFSRLLALKARLSQKRKQRGTGSDTPNPFI